MNIHLSDRHDILSVTFNHDLQNIDSQIVMHSEKVIAYREKSTRRGYAEYNEPNEIPCFNLRIKWRNNHEKKYEDIVFVNFLYSDLSYDEREKFLKIFLEVPFKVVHTLKKRYPNSIENDRARKQEYYSLKNILAKKFKYEEIRLALILISTDTFNFIIQDRTIDLILDSENELWNKFQLGTKEYGLIFNQFESIFKPVSFHYTNPQHLELNIMINNWLSNGDISKTLGETIKEDLTLKQFNKDNSRHEICRLSEIISSQLFSLLNIRDLKSNVSIECFIEQNKNKLGIDKLLRLTVFDMFLMYKENVSEFKRNFTDVVKNNEPIEENNILKIFEKHNGDNLHLLEESFYGIDRIYIEALYTWDKLYDNGVYIPLKLIKNMCQ